MTWTRDDADVIEDIIQPPWTDMPAVEDGIRHHLNRLNKLRLNGARLLAAQGEPEAAIGRWLVDRGAAEDIARALAEQVVREHRQATEPRR